ncbi:hypothetical protein DIPPA_30307 [Diplonema papillatum]|nr:hypothetical protein DIPPA_30307 [Diplonema papillatum]
MQRHYVARICVLQRFCRAAVAARRQERAAAAAAVQRVARGWLARTAVLEAEFALVHGWYVARVCVCQRFVRRSLARRAAAFRRWKRAAAPVWTAWVAGLPRHRPPPAAHAVEQWQREAALFQERRSAAAVVIQCAARAAAARRRLARHRHLEAAEAWRSARLEAAAFVQRAAHAKLDGRAADLHRSAHAHSCCTVRSEESCRRLLGSGFDVLHGHLGSLRAAQSARQLAFDAAAAAVSSSRPCASGRHPASAEGRDVSRLHPTGNVERLLREAATGAPTLCSDGARKGDQAPGDEGRGVSRHPTGDDESLLREAATGTPTLCSDGARPGLRDGQAAGDEGQGGVSRLHATADAESLLREAQCSGDPPRPGPGDHQPAAADEAGAGDAAPESGHVQPGDCGHTPDPPRGSHSSGQTTDASTPRTKSDPGDCGHTPDPPRGSHSSPSGQTTDASTPRTKSDPTPNDCAKSPAPDPAGRPVIPPPGHPTDAPPGAGTGQSGRGDAQEVPAGVLRAVEKVQRAVRCWRAKGRCEKRRLRRRYEDVLVACWEATLEGGIEELRRAEAQGRSAAARLEAESIAQAAAYGFAVPWPLSRGAAAALARAEAEARSAVAGGEITARTSAITRPERASYSRHFRLHVRSSCARTHPTGSALTTADTHPPGPAPIASSAQPTAAPRGVLSEAKRAPAVAGEAAAERVAKASATFFGAWRAGLRGLREEEAGERALWAVPSESIVSLLRKTLAAGGPAAALRLWDGQRHCEIPPWQRLEVAGRRRVEDTEDTARTAIRQVAAERAPPASAEREEQALRSPATRRNSQEKDACLPSFLETSSTDDNRRHPETQMPSTRLLSASRSPLLSPVVSPGKDGSFAGSEAGEQTRVPSAHFLSKAGLPAGTDLLPPVVSPGKDRQRGKDGNGSFSDFEAGEQTQVPSSRFLSMPKAGLPVCRVSASDLLSPVVSPGKDWQRGKESSFAGFEAGEQTQVPSSRFPSKAGVPAGTDLLSPFVSPGKSGRWRDSVRDDGLSCGAAELLPLLHPRLSAAAFAPPHLTLREYMRAHGRACDGEGLPDLPFKNASYLPPLSTQTASILRAAAAAGGGWDGQPGFGEADLASPSAARSSRSFRERLATPAALLSPPHLRGSCAVLSAFSGQVQTTSSHGNPLCQLLNGRVSSAGKPPGGGPPSPAQPPGGRQLSHSRKASTGGKSPRGVFSPSAVASAPSPELRLDCRHHLLRPQEIGTGGSPRNEFAGDCVSSSLQLDHRQLLRPQEITTGRSPRNEFTGNSVASSMQLDHRELLRPQEITPGRSPRNEFAGNRVSSPGLPDCRQQASGGRRPPAAPEPPGPDCGGLRALGSATFPPAAAGASPPRGRRAVDQFPELLPARAWIRRGSRSGFRHQRTPDPIALLDERPRVQRAPTTRCEPTPPRIINSPATTPEPVSRLPSPPPGDVPSVDPRAAAPQPPSRAAAPGRASVYLVQGGGGKEPEVPAGPAARDGCSAAFSAANGARSAAESPRVPPVTQRQLVRNTAQTATLDLEGFGLDEATVVSYLAALSLNRSVTVVKLGGNSFGSKAAALLAEVLRSPSCKLVSVRLNNCRLTGECLATVASALRGNTSLVALDVSHNPDLSSETVRKLSNTFAARLQERLRKLPASSARADLPMAVY